MALIIRKRGERRATSELPVSHPEDIISTRPSDISHYLVLRDSETKRLREKEKERVRNYVVDLIDAFRGSILGFLMYYDSLI